MTKRHVIIAGDSVACGEWAPGWTLHQQKLIHHGLAQYLADHDFQVWNLARPDGTNVETLRALWSFFRGSTWTNGVCVDEVLSGLECIIVFATDWHRDLRVMNIAGSNEHNYLLESYDSHLGGRWISWWYHRLSELAQENQVRIGLVGGWCDLPRHDSIEQDHPGLYYACQSLFNLCVNDSADTRDPVMVNWWPADLVTLAYDRSNSAGKTDILAQVSHTNQRERLRQVNPQWYAPDIMHPNREAHQRLFRHLRETKLVQID